MDSTVLVSLKNGGGIRANVGEVIVSAGGTEEVRSPNEELVDSEGNVIKPTDGISQIDIETTLSFNNGLALLTLTEQELIDVLEHVDQAFAECRRRLPANFGRGVLV